MLHAIVTYHWLRSRPCHAPHAPLLQAGFAFVVGAVGGSGLTSFILGRPLNPIMSNSLAIYWSVFLLMRVPLPGRPFGCRYVGDAVFGVANWPPIRMILYVLDMQPSGLAITQSGADFAIAKAPNSDVACLLVGITSGCGGGTLVDALSLDDNGGNSRRGMPVAWSLRPPAVLANTPHATMFLRSIVASCVYWVLRNPHGTLPWPAPRPDELDADFARAVVVLILAAMALLEHIPALLPEPAAKAMRSFMQRRYVGVFVIAPPVPPPPPITAAATKALAAARASAVARQAQREKRQSIQSPKSAGGKRQSPSKRKYE